MSKSIFTLLASLLLAAGVATAPPTQAAGSLQTTATRSTQQAPRGITPVAPILRLDTAMHTAKITNIDIDAAERYLVTGSDDKTVRVWSLADGQLLRVLRLPIAKGNEGKVFAVAISPDGETVAVGGWTSKTGIDESIYLFNRATGELRQRLTKLPNVINHLAYSIDGRVLVASLAEHGIRVYRTADYRLQAKDTNYGNSSYWAEFDRHGRLVTSCYDGYIRLYNQQFQLLTKRSKAPGGNQPFAVRFSPTGDKIAVGFVDSTRVNVLSGDNLALLYSPNTQGVNNGILNTVAWSQDGRWLYAGGGYREGISRPILRWPQAGRGNYQTWSASSSTIMDIRALRDGGIVFGAGEPDFGRFNANGQKTLARQAEIADFRGVFEGGFLLSEDGSTVQFGYESGGKRPASFSLNERLLTAGTNRGLERLPNLTPPRTQASGLNITGWKNTTAPKLNGQALSLKQYEIARSLAIAPDGQQFLLGTEWYLRLFDKHGKQQWQVPVPGIAWGVNIAGNGNVAVAAFGDGTLRWYRLTDGQPLLALFPHKDGQRWVLWTPQGYYAASPGAEQLIGWHINNGPEQAADFYAIARFRQRYYRPDVIAKVLDTRDLKQALHLANQEAQLQQQQQALQRPPVITLFAPQNGETFSNTNLELRYRLRNPSNAPMKSIQVLIDGRPLQRSRDPGGITEDGQSHRLMITVPPKDIKVSLIAENQHAASEPATVRLRWQGQSQPTEFVIKPKLYLLAIGVSDYQDDHLDLSYADKDAQDLAQLLRTQAGRLYRAVDIKLLTNATKGDILDGLEWIERQTTQHDVAMVFFAGHGVNDNKGRYYFLPRDVDTNKLKRTAIAYHQVKETVTTLPGKALFFIDTCHSGNIMGARRGIGDIDQIANDLSAAENGVIVFASATGSQFAKENARWQNGAFTEALLEGLGGKADYTKDGAISINELDLYTSERVKKTHQRQPNPNHHQTANRSGLSNRFGPLKATMDDRLDSQSLSFGRPTGLFLNFYYKLKVRRPPVVVGYLSMRIKNEK